MTLLLHRCPSPVGELSLVHDVDGCLLALDFAEREDPMRARLARRLPETAIAAGAGSTPTHSALTAYFLGDLRALESVPFRLLGTEFQRRVWGALRGIPAGQTWSYGDVARRIGKPSAVRAVGLANASNPLMLVVPCHRVVGHSGRLTGYAGGLPRKAQLLAHERAQQPPHGAYSSSSSS